jgi:hypothetical protein
MVLIVYLLHDGENKYVGKCGRVQGPTGSATTFYIQSRSAHIKWTEPANHNNTAPVRGVERGR